MKIRRPIHLYDGAITADALIFAGEIVTVQQFYDADKPANVAYHLSCTDWTRALTRRKVLKYLRDSIGVGDRSRLMASRLGDGFTTNHVAPDLPAVAIDFTNEDMNRALTRLANRVGAYLVHRLHEGFTFLPK